ncbi:hypothetical protein KVH24_00010 [Streptomyces olivaceus]|nr:hypothetical protein [Streptomyces olivaceus]MBZ6177406.1 hypothetical protein [Streptomyces olivaceus]
MTLFVVDLVELRRENRRLRVDGEIRADGVPGDFMETGVWRGGIRVMMRAVLRAYGVTDRGVWVADSFEGMPVADASTHVGPGSSSPTAATTSCRRICPRSAGTSSATTCSTPAGSATRCPPLRWTGLPCCTRTATCTSRRWTPWSTCT